MARRIAVQVVLLGATQLGVSKLVGAVAASARRIREQARADEVVLLLGDRTRDLLLGPGTVAELTERGTGEGLSDVSYEHLGARVGFAAGHNRLARHSEAEVMVVMEQHAYPSPDVLCELIAALERPGASLVDARHIPLEHPKAYDLETGDTSWASATCLAIRRSTFEALQGFDDASFSREGADVDLSWRVRMLGERVVHAPRAVVFCTGSLSAGPVAGRNGQAPGHESPEDEATASYDELLAHLLLATKASRDDVVESTLLKVDEAGSAEERRAAAMFERLRSEGLLPAPYEDVTAATFSGRHYALHRF